MQTEDRLYSKGLPLFHVPQLDGLQASCFQPTMLSSILLSIELFRFPRLNLKHCLQDVIGAHQPLRWNNWFSSILCFPKGWGLLQGRAVRPASPCPWHPAQSLVPSSCSRNVKQGPSPAPCSSQIALPTHMAKKIQTRLAGTMARVSLS